MLFTCATHAPVPDWGGGRQVSNGSKSLTVDIHCHCASQAAAALIAEAKKDTGEAPVRPGNPLTQKIAKQQSADIESKMYSVEERLADMDRMGIDIQAISPAPSQFFYWAEDGLAREAATLINDNLADIAARHPDRFVALGNVPLQNANMAVQELERCVKERGMRGVEICSNVNGEELSHPRLEKFFAKAEELEILIFMHPSGFTHPQRFGDHYLGNLIGNPLDSSVAIAHLIFDGVLERYPGLRICVAHGGGYPPAYAGRFDHGYHARADCRQHISAPPSSYLRKFYFDTMVFEPDQLGFLIEKYGSDHILLGSDYPYDMGDTDPLGLVAQVEALSEQDRDKVRGLNAARLLNISETSRR